MDENGSEPVAGPSRPRTIATGNGASSPSTIAIPSTGELQRIFRCVMTYSTDTYPPRCRIFRVPPPFVASRPRVALPTLHLTSSKAVHDLPPSARTTTFKAVLPVLVSLSGETGNAPRRAGSGGDGLGVASGSGDRVEAFVWGEEVVEAPALGFGGMFAIGILRCIESLSVISLSVVQIKILRAGWLRDGTWPTDPRTSRAIKPPDSPTSIRSFELSITALDSNEQILAEQNTTRQEQDDQVGRTEVTAWPWTNGVPAYGQANAGET
jgi:hypothetical protein